MNNFSFGKFPLLIGMASLLVSCDSKNEPEVSQSGAVASTADLAREARFSPWTSKAGLQLKMENLEGDQYFSTVEGRLKDGANQYRAISAPFDGSTYREWSVIWGFTESELFLHEIRLLRAGFNRHNSQVFTDSSGVALHQLTMLRRAGVTGSTVPPQVSPNGSSNFSPVPVVEVKPEEIPDFMQPELRRIDDAIVTQKTPVPDPVIDEAVPASISGVTEESVPSEVMEITPDPPKAEVPPMVEVAEDPEPEPKVAIDLKPEPEVEKPKAEPESKPKPKAEPKSAPKVVSYRVVKGDTLSSIARRHKVRISDIKRANGLRSDIIRLRQVLKIPKK